MHYFLKLFNKILRSFRRQPLLHLASISTISVSCLILAFCLLVYRNFDYLAEKTQTSATGTVYLKDNLNAEETNKIRESLLFEDGIVRVEYKSKSTVSKELNAFLGGSDQSEVPGSELFPDLFEVYFKPQISEESLVFLKSNLGSNPHITGVDFSADWFSQFKKMQSILSVGGLILILFLSIGCSFIIANFMGMRHQSRKAEMEIIQLIGAHTSFVLAPFISEGVIEGVLGAMTSIVLLFITFSALGEIIPTDWASMLGVSSWVFISAGQAIIVGMIGILMAVIGSLVVFFRTSEQSRR